MGDKKAELSKYKIEHTHYIFTVESGAQIRKLLSDYEQGQALLGVRRIGRREEQKSKEKWSKEQRATERKPSAAKPKQMPQKKNGTAPYGKRKPKKP